MTHDERLEICRSCPKFNKDFQTCSICGCIMPLKVKMHFFSCPDNPPKWGKEKVSDLWKTSSVFNMSSQESLNNFTEKFLDYLKKDNG